MRVRIIAKAKNENFYQARMLAGYPTPTALAKAIHSGIASICAYESFKHVPRYKKTIKKLEEALHVPFDYLFDEETIRATRAGVPRKYEFVKEIRLLPGDAVLLLPDSPEQIEIKNERIDNLDEALGLILERERRVLIARFGLDGSAPKTLEEVAVDMRVTRERIRQIEAKALRKLKHPSRSRKIKPSSPFIAERAPIIKAIRKERTIHPWPCKYCEDIFNHRLELVAHCREAHPNVPGKRGPRFGYKKHKPIPTFF